MQQRAENELHPSSKRQPQLVGVSLQVTKRTGWVRCNVQQPESIAGGRDAEVVHKYLTQLSLYAEHVPYS